MSAPIKIDEAMFSEIKMLQSKFQESIYKMGNLQVEKMELDRRVNEFIETEKRLKDEWMSLQKLDKSLFEKISKTYGDGNLSVETGMFTPSVITTVPAI